MRARGVICHDRRPLVLAPSACARLATVADDCARQGVGLIVDSNMKLILGSNATLQREIFAGADHW